MKFFLALSTTLLAGSCLSSAQGQTDCSYAGDGECDSWNNIAECDYDEGDCCYCDCVDGDFYECGINGYDCIDPYSSCTSATLTTDTSATCYFEGDGWCDSFNNDADCNYDGGDCCECDCVDSSYTCGIDDYDCVDPFSSCQSTLTLTSGTSATCLLEGDGWCDTGNNNADCNYDGGDCCECDCVDTTYTCGIFGYSCLDPASTCQYHHYYDDDGTFATDDDSVVVDDDDGYVATDDDDGVVIYDDDGYVVTDDDDGVVIYDDDGVVIYDDDDYIVTTDSTFESEDDNDINRPSPIVTDDDGNDAGGDDAPVGIIVGGAAGGAVFLGALAVLACCMKTGRLKNCCSGGGAAGSAVPPRAQPQAPTTGYPENGAAPPPATVGTAAGPPHPQSFDPPPAYKDGGPRPAPSVQAYPLSEAPPPAYED